MDPPGCSSEPAQLDDTLLHFDPDSLLDAWVADLFAAEDHSTHHDARPASMPTGNIFPGVDNLFDSNESAFGLGPLDHIQIPDMPQDCVSGLGPSMTDLQGVDPSSTLDPSVLPQSDAMGLQFSTGGDQNPPSDVTMEDFPSSSCTNLGDLREEAANFGNSIAFPLPNSMPIGSSEFDPQAHDSRATHRSEYFEGQLTNAPGASQHAHPTSFTPLGILPQTLGPGVLTRRQLPPKRRGGRRGKLSREQARQQRETKLSGVCIRCRMSNIACGGGIPCGPCLKILGKSRIWKTLCTKAQFLDIIEAGSTFPSMIEEEIVLFKNLDIRSMLILMSSLKTMLQQEPDRYAVIQLTAPLGQACQIPWAMVGSILGSIFGDLHEDPCNWTAPSFSKVDSTLADYVRKNYSTNIVKFGAETDEPHTPQWAGLVIAFCQRFSSCQPPESTIDSALPQFPADDAGRLASSLVGWTGWIASRYLELSLFHYLQVTSNNASFDSVEDRKSYILYIFNTLLLSARHPQSIHKDSIDEKDPRIIPLYHDLFDRQSRVRSALWVYCSIAIRGLPAWTNIRETIHQDWPFIQVEGLAQQFNKSVTAFNNSLNDTWESLIDSYRRLDDYYRLLLTMHPDFEEEASHKKEPEPDFTKCMDSHFRKFLYTDRFDDQMEEHDQRLTGGVLSAQTTSQKRAVSTRAFATLAIIDWGRKTVLPFDPAKPVSGHQDLLQCFVEQVLRRLIGMQLHATYAERRPTGTSLEELIENAMANEASSPTPQRSSELLKKFIQSGQRWNELQDMVGPEVVLMHKPFRHPRHDLQRFYIPSIVENGTERQFTRLKEIIPTRLQWLAEACVELRGLVHMLVTALTTERENATVIQNQIQTMVTTVFGSRSSVEKALMSSWAQQDLVLQGLTEFLRPEAVAIPLDIKVGMSLCLFINLDTNAREKPDMRIDFEMKENVCHGAESLMERDCSTLDSESRSELRVWSHKVLDFLWRWYSC